jgi:hypothetical protein
MSLQEPILWQDVQATSNPTDRQPATEYKIRLGGHGYYNHHTMIQFDSVMVDYDDDEGARYFLITDDKISTMLTDSVLSEQAARDLRAISQGQEEVV